MDSIGLMMVILFTTMLLVLVTVLALQRKASHRREMEQGIPLEAVIETVEDTGRVRDYDELLVFYLTVAFTYQGERITAREKAYISPSQMVLPGSRVWVSYNPVSRKATLMSPEDTARYAPQGYNPQGYNPQGYNPQGYNPQGYNPAYNPAQSVPIQMVMPNAMQGVILSAVPVGKTADRRTQMDVVLRVTRPGGVYEVSLRKDGVKGPSSVKNG